MKKIEYILAKETMDRIWKMLSSHPLPWSIIPHRSSGWEIVTADQHRVGICDSHELAEAVLEEAHTLAMGQLSGTGDYIIAFAA